MTRTSFYDSHSSLLFFLRVHQMLYQTEVGLPLGSLIFKKKKYIYIRIYYLYIYTYISPNRPKSPSSPCFLAKPTIQPVEGINLTDGLLDYSHKDNRGMKANVTSTHDIWWDGNLKRREIQRCYCTLFFGARKLTCWWKYVGKLL